MRDDLAKFEALGASVIAIAPEGVDGLSRYPNNGQFPFALVGDEDHRTFDAYDVASRAFSLGQRPAVFVVDRDGIVRFDSVGTQQWQIPRNDEVLATLQALGSPPSG
ncbi:MAG: redoxin domain-containing protein [Actinobacteria bacterium]|nr:redoxin domain-containing protein [Actinomycetota bacterium]